MAFSKGPLTGILLAAVVVGVAGMHGTTRGEEGSVAVIDMESALRRARALRPT